MSQEEDCINFSQYLDKTPDGNNLREKRFIWGHGFQEFKSIMAGRHEGRGGPSIFRPY